MKSETNLVQAIALFVLLSLIPITFFIPSGTALVWTILIPLIPLMIVLVGYNRWRKLCPLAWVASVGQYLQWIPKRKVPKWFENNYYLFQFFLLFMAFTARLLYLNFEGVALSLFFIFVALAAFFINLIFSGKTWCNFFCPIGIVEKIYCGSNALQSQQTSACSRCVACKNNCPDIDMEKGYWKESSDASKRITFYAFPGLVFGFYAYYYVISGTWSYYFDGAWTGATRLFQDPLSPGIFFLPIVPKIIAAPLTLLFFSALSYLFFTLFERVVPHCKWAANKDPKSVEHIVKAFAAFSAFNLFYMFAGAPAYNHFPLTYALFHFIVVVVSSVILWKEIFREERFYLQERFALKILKKWKGSTPPPTNLKEIYYTYSNQQENQQDKLDLYKETVLELLSDGTLSKEDFTLLDKIREQLGLSEDEHNKIIRSLKRDNSILFDEAHALSSEKIYQLKIYKEHLQELLAQESDADEITKAQKRFHINDEEHQQIYKELVKGSSSLPERIEKRLKHLKQSAKLIAALTFHQEKKSASYLLFILTKNFEKSFQHLCNTMILLSPTDKTHLLSLTHQVCSYCQRESEENITLHLPDLIHDEYNRELKEIIEILQDHVMYDQERLILIIREHLRYDDEELTSAILYYFHEYKLDGVINYYDYMRSECLLISEITRAMREKSKNITTIEIMAYLHVVPIFSTLVSEELFELAQETKRVSFRKGEDLVKQGDRGDLFYIITQGSANVHIQKQGQETLLATLHKGDYIGEVSIISKTKRTATVTAKDRLQALELSSHSFEKLLNRNPHLALRIMKDITVRLLEQNNS